MPLLSTGHNFAKQLSKMCVLCWALRARHWFYLLFIYIIVYFIICLCNFIFGNHIKTKNSSKSGRSKSCRLTCPNNFRETLRAKTAFYHINQEYKGVGRHHLLLTKRIRVLYARGKPGKNLQQNTVACWDTKRITVRGNYSWLVAGFHQAGHVAL